MKNEFKDLCSTVGISTNQAVENDFTTLELKAILKVRSLTKTHNIRWINSPTLLNVKSLFGD